MIRHKRPKHMTNETCACDKQDQDIPQETNVANKMLPCTRPERYTAPHFNTLQLKRCCPAPPPTMGVTQQPPNAYTRNPFKTCIDNHNDDEWFCCFKIDWCCLYYLRRDSLVALLEALFACNVGPCCRFYLLNFSWIRGFDYNMTHACARIFACVDVCVHYDYHCILEAVLGDMLSLWHAWLVTC